MTSIQGMEPDPVWPAQSEDGRTAWAPLDALRDAPIGKAVVDSQLCWVCLDPTVARMLGRAVPRRLREAGSSLPTIHGGAPARVLLDLAGVHAQADARQEGPFGVVVDLRR